LVEKTTGVIFFGLPLTGDEG